LPADRRCRLKLRRRVDGGNTRQGRRRCLLHQGKGTNFRSAAAGAECPPSWLRFEARGGSEARRAIGIERSPSSVGCLGEKTDRPISQRSVDRYRRRLSADLGEKSVGQQGWRARYARSREQLVPRATARTQ
jgi:hypothetical protein